MPWIHLKTDDYDKAIADLSESLRLKPDQQQTLNWLVAAHIARGKTHREMRQFDRAIADCTEAIRIDPKSAEAFAIRGDTRWYKKEYGLATADLTEAIRLDPKKDFKDMLDKVCRSIRNAMAKDAPSSQSEPIAVHKAPAKTPIQSAATLPTSSSKPGVYYLNHGSWHLLESDDQLESLAQSKTITHSTLVLVVPSENTTPMPISSLPSLRAVVDQYSKPRSGIWSALKTGAKVVGLLGLHVINETAKRAGAPAGYIFCAKCREAVKTTATVCPHCREDPHTPF